MRMTTALTGVGEAIASGDGPPERDLAVRHAVVSLDLSRLEREFFSAMTEKPLSLDWRHFDPPFPLAATDRLFINGWVAKQHGGTAREWRWTVLGLSVAAQYLMGG